MEGCRQVQCSAVSSLPMISDKFVYNFSKRESRACLSPVVRGPKRLLISIFWVWPQQHQPLLWEIESQEDDA